MLGLVLAVLLVVAAALLFGKGRKENPDVPEASDTEMATEAFGGEKISGDLFVDYSAIAGAGENAMLNLSGMTREEAGQALKGKYQWTLKVVNTNPNLDKFEMPIIPETEDIPFVQTWPQVLKKRGILTLIWLAGAAIAAGIIVLLF